MENDNIIPSTASRASEAACCNAAGLPWFHRDYGSTTTTEYLELRVCGDEGTGNEDAPVAWVL